jgi:hypothetical protein
MEKLMTTLRLFAALVRVVGVLTCLVLGPVASATVEAPALSPGLWETVVTNEVPGTDMKRTTTARLCLTAEMIRNSQQGQQLLPRQGDFASKCTVKDYKFAANVANWSLSCTTKTGTLGGPGTIAFKVAEFSGTATLSAKDSGKTTKVNQALTGKRISDCK